MTDIGRRLLRCTRIAFRAAGILSIFMIRPGMTNAQESSTKHLEDFLAEGVRNSPVLVELETKIGSVSLDSALIHAGLLPQLTLNGTGQFAPVVHGYGYDDIVTNGGTLSALISMSIPVVGADNRRNRYDETGYRSSSLSTDRTIAENSLRKEITAHYLDVFADQQELSYLENYLSLLEKEEGLLRDLSNDGTYRRVDYLTFLAGIEHQRLERTRLRMQWHSDYAALLLACGSADTATATLAEPEIRPGPDRDPRSTPLYHRLRIDSLSLAIEDLRIDFDYDPEVLLLADAGYLSSFMLHGERNVGASVGFSMSLPIFDGGRKAFRHDQVALRERARGAYRDAFLVRFARQSSLLIRLLRDSDTLVAQAEREADAVDALVAAHRALLSTGDARIAEYMLAVSDDLSAHQLVTRQRMNRLHIINDWNYLGLSD